MKWYLKPIPIVIAILIIGPFALPLVWMSPALKKWHKTAVTIILVLVTIWLVQVSVSIYQLLMTEMKSLQETLY